MIQVSVDRPSVNLKFYKKLANERSDSGISALLDFGSWSLHIVNSVFQRGTEQSGWNVKKTLKSAWEWFHDSPARRDDYETLTGSTTFTVAYCATRWVESMSVANRGILIWPNIVKIIFFEKNSQDISNHSASVMKMSRSQLMNSSQFTLQAFWSRF